MAKKSKELSEEDKVTETPKKGTKGKKIVAEQTLGTDSLDQVTLVEVLETPSEPLVQDEEEVTEGVVGQTDSISIPLENSPEV